MEVLCFSVIVVMAIRCVSFGITTVKRQNVAGGLAAAALAVGSVLCGWAVFS